MDNASDALVMAGSVLLFVIAISVAILSFSTAREAIDVMLNYADRDSSALANDSRFYYLSSESDTNRYVGKETILPTLYRAYDENYKVVFIFDDSSNYYLYQKDGQKISKIDLTNRSDFPTSTIAKEFLDGIVFGKTGADKIEFERKFDVSLNGNSLNDYLNVKERTKRIKESMGVYFSGDIGNSLEDRVKGYTTANENEKKVITYTFE